MARQESLSVLKDPEGKALLAEIYKGVIENVSKGTISSRIKNMELSGDPEAGSVEAKRFANAISKEYGTARTNGRGDYTKLKPITIKIDTDREMVEEIEQKDISLLGVDGLLRRRAANHAVRMIAELDRAFFANGAENGTQFNSDEIDEAEILESAIVTVEMTKNEYVDGVSRDLMSVTCSPEFYSKIRTYLDKVTHNANVNTAAEEFFAYHGVRCWSSNNLPQGVDFMIMVDGSIAQPVLAHPYSAEKIPLSEAFAVELFYYYGTGAVTPDLILYSRSLALKNLGVPSYTYPGTDVVLNATGIGGKVRNTAIDGVKVVALEGVAPVIAAADVATLGYDPSTTNVACYAVEIPNVVGDFDISKVKFNGNAIANTDLKVINGVNYVIVCQGLWEADGAIKSAYNSFTLGYDTAIDNFSFDFSKLTLA